ncbi:unnamed protein product [Closterium sp. NIES-54]
MERGNFFFPPRAPSAALVAAQRPARRAPRGVRRFRRWPVPAPLQPVVDPFTAHRGLCPAAALSRPLPCSRPLGPALQPPTVAALPSPPVTALALQPPPPCRGPALLLPQSRPYLRRPSRPLPCSRRSRPRLSPARRRPSWRPQGPARSPPPPSCSPRAAPLRLLSLYICGVASKGVSGVCGLPCSSSSSVSHCCSCR